MAPEHPLKRGHPRHPGIGSFSAVLRSNICQREGCQDVPKVGLDDPCRNQDCQPGSSLDLYKTPIAVPPFYGGEVINRNCRGVPCLRNSIAATSSETTTPNWRPNWWDLEASHRSREMAAGPRETILESVVASVKKRCCRKSVTLKSTLSIVVLDVFDSQAKEKQHPPRDTHGPVGCSGSSNFRNTRVGKNHMVWGICTDSKATEESPDAAQNVYFE